MICAYCGKESKRTKEHIISKGVLDLFPECCYTINGDGNSTERSRVYFAQPMVNDVCAECNNKKISYIDSYAKKFIEEYFIKEYKRDDSLEIKYEFSLIQKMLLKYAYNDLRANNKNIDFFTDEIKKYLMNENLNEPLKNVSILGGLAVNTSPMPLWMKGNVKIEWGDSPLFVSDYIAHLDYATGEVIQKMEERKLKTIYTAYIFRFYTGQFILICWDGKEEDIELDKQIVNSLYPYKELDNSGKSVLKRCTGYLNYHMLKVIDTITGLNFQDEMSLSDPSDKEYLQRLNKEWEKEEETLKIKYKKKK